MQSVIDFLNANKSTLCLLAVILLQIAAANNWLVVPPNVLTTISALGAGAALATTPHSNAVTARLMAAKKGGK